MNKQLIAAAEAVLRRADVDLSQATVLVALSGGADSVALLHTMLALRKRYGLTVCAAHVEHGLRGEESLADAAFCEALCKEHQVPFTCDHAQLAGDMQSAGAEAAARQARYALLLNRAKACGADALLLAHHQDDQAETVLQHLLRGSGARGLRGMEAIIHRDGVTVCRPFLSLSKQQLLDALDGKPYRSDASNHLPVCLRNRMRLYILPRLVDENPAAIAHIAQSADLLRLDEDCLQAQADQLLEDALIDKPPYFCLNKDTLQTASDAIVIRALRRFAELGLRACGSTPAEQSLSVTDSLALLHLVTAPDNTVVNLPGALHASVTEAFIHLTRMQGDAPLCPVPAPAPCAFGDTLQPVDFGDIQLLKAPYPSGRIHPDGQYTVVLTRELLAAAVVRWPKQGDTIHPFGADGSKPLRRWLIDKKLDQPFRKALPVVAIGRQILWAVGVGAAEETRVTDAPSVLLSLRGDVPWLY